LRLSGGAAVLVAGLVSAAFADVPRFLNYQGKLADPSGNPLTGAYSFRFSLYDVPSGGSPLFSEILDSANAVSVVNGVYTVQIGVASGGLPPSAFVGDDLYLEIQVNTGSLLASPETLSPRQRIAAVGYAIRALSSEGLAIGPVISTYTATGDLLLPGSVYAAYGVSAGTHVFVGLPVAPDSVPGTVYFDSVSGVLRLRKSLGYEEILTGTGTTPSNMMTTDTAQLVTGVKTFAADPAFNASAIPDAAIAGLSASKLTGILPSSVLSGAYPGALTFGSSAGGPVAFSTNVVVSASQFRLGNFASLPLAGSVGASVRFQALIGLRITNTEVVTLQP